MNHIKLTQIFWAKHRQKLFTGTDTLLYFYLLNEASIEGWPNDFTLPDSRILADLKIRRVAMTGARNRLKEAGVLDFKGGYNPSDRAIYNLYTATGYKLGSFETSQVYLMMDTPGLCKIGTSDDPKKRIKQISSELDTPDLRLIASFPGGHQEERRVQAHYKLKHVWAEWYSLSAEDVQVFQRLAQMKNR